MLKFLILSFDQNNNRKKELLMLKKFGFKKKCLTKNKKLK